MLSSGGALGPLGAPPPAKRPGRMSRGGLGRRRPGHGVADTGPGVVV